MPSLPCFACEDSFTDDNFESAQIRASDKQRTRILNDTMAHPTLQIELIRCVFGQECIELCSIVVTAILLCGWEDFGCGGQSWGVSACVVVPNVQDNAPRQPRNK